MEIRFNANGTVKAETLTKQHRIATGKANWTLEANLNTALRKVKLGQVALLPSGRERLRVKGGWLAIACDTFEELVEREGRRRAKG